MKKLWLLLTCAATLLFGLGFADSAEARGLILYGIGPEYSIIQTLPKTEDWEDADHEHYDLAVMYNQFSLFFIPIWNYGIPKYALIRKSGFNEFTYIELETAEYKETLDALKKEYKLPDKATIPLMTQIGGKPIIILLIAFFVWRALRKKEEPVEGENAENAEGNPPEGEATAQGDAPEGEATAQGDAPEGEATAQGDNADAEASAQGDNPEAEAKDEAPDAAKGS